jgi:ComF family protein
MHNELLTTLYNRITRSYQFTLDTIVAPPFCAHCKQFLSARQILCIECYQMIDPVVSVALPVTSNVAINVMAIGNYQEPLKSMILAKAWGDIVACNQLGQLLWQVTYFKSIPCDYLVPIPLHWLRFAKRGYNQAHEIADTLATYKKVPVAPLLKRVRYTPFQSSIALAQRAENVKDIFMLKQPIDARHYHSKHIVLVDDLMTTGATLVSAAKALLPLKPASINAIVVCRVV